MNAELTHNKGNILNKYLERFSQNITQNAVIPIKANINALNALSSFCLHKKTAHKNVKNVKIY